MTHSNISIFVPHAGCPHRCSFCDQHSISGTVFQPDADYVKRICSEALECSASPADTEIAFFGGSFTAIRRDYMTELLDAAYEFIGEGKFKGIRISTRPDCIDNDILKLLKNYGVTSIELGAQSMNDKVLELNERGHTSLDVINASRLIRKHHFELGLQMMIGLYGSTITTEYDTANAFCHLNPDTVRIYPVVILKNTRLGELYQKGVFKPFEFEQVIDMTADFIKRFEGQGIKVIKVGLHASEIVENEMLGGFYHPAFRELCESRIYRSEIEKLFDGPSLIISVPARNLSKAVGQRKSNIRYFEEHGKKLTVIPDVRQTDMIRIIKN